jgi:putative transposase
MPRIPRGQLIGHAFHLLNRGNGRATVFRNEGDYGAFIRLLAPAKYRAHVRVAAFCVMPNHFHLVVEPESCVGLSVLMQWWLTSHVRRYHTFYGTSGHVWQGRFKSFPIQQDEHFLTVVRYVLQNPVRAGLAKHARGWPWSSIAHPELVDSWPVPLPDLASWLDEPLTNSELEQLRHSAHRQTPFGSPTWTQTVSALLGLESTLRPRGRPRKGDRLEGTRA